jgi:hypothetical protein
MAKYAGVDGRILLRRRGAWGCDEGYHAEEQAMFYMIEFDQKPGVNRKQVTEAYQRFADHFAKLLPQFKLIGLYSRDLYLGHRPQYLALWEFSAYADLDAWEKLWTTDEGGRRLAQELSGLVLDWDAKVMAKLI